MSDDNPINVAEPQEVEDLTDVKEERRAKPLCKGLKVRIFKASANKTKNGDLKYINLELQIVDGIEIINKETEEAELKYVNSKVFTRMMDTCYWANPETKTKQYFVHKQHLVGFKKLMSALELPLKGTVVNDEFIQSITGREILIDIIHEKETVLNESTGKYDETGNLRDRAVNFAKVE